jgi:iron complex outermembrane receptor protein
MRPFKNFILASTLLSTAGLGTHAFAQDKPKTETAKSSDDVQVVVVTGSHIRRKDLNTASPEITITSQQAVESGTMTVADLVQKLPQAANSEQTNGLLGSYIVTGGPGSETLSLYGLGAQNTLVLVNGRRMGPAGVQGSIGPIDLNVLPLQAFKQVDVLLDGSSSIYGSDAVGGVINFVTKKNTDGMDLIVQGDVPFKPHGTDYTLTFTGGKTFDKGYVSLVASYYENTGLRVKDRKDTACAEDVYFDPSTGQRSDFLDTSGHYRCNNLLNDNFQGYGFGGEFQLPVAGMTYPADGRLATLPGWVRAGRAGHPDTQPYLNIDTPKYGNQTVIEPVRTASLLASGGYDVSSTMHLYTELLFNQRQSENHGIYQLFPYVSPNNPTNTVAAGLYAALPSGYGYARPIIPYDNFTRVKVDYFRGVFGVNGTFQNFGPLNGFSYDTYYQISDSDGRYGQTFIYNDRVNATTDGSGKACNPALMTVSPTTCVTIPWFTADVLAGNFTDAQRNFLIGYETGHTKYIQQTIESNISGNVFQLPAGAVSAVGGIFLESDQQNDTPGYNARNQNYWGFSTAGITKGQTTTEQAYAEVYAPLIKNVPGIQHLDLTASGRIANYSVAGTNSTYKLGMVWNINSEFAFTVTRGTSFRAPSIYEKNLANQVGFFDVIDPCTNWADSTSTKVQTRCAAQGIPNNYPGELATPEDVTGGGSHLKPETSRNTNFGFAWTPAWADLKVKVNYNSILDFNKIVTFGAQNIVNACYSTDAYPNFFCSLITRGANHDITVVTDDYLNVGQVDNRNIGLEVTYAKKFPFGRFSVRSNSSWQLKNQETLGDVVTDYTGSVGSPVFTNGTWVDLVTSDWTYHWDFQLTGKTSDLRFYNYNATQPATANYPHGYNIQVVTPFYQVHNLSVTRNFDKLRITFGIKNVFDVKAPTLSAGEFRVGTAALNMYDLLGRTAFVTIDKHF